MSEDKEIIISEAVQLGTVQATSPQDVIKRAEAVATPLANLINERNLFTKIGNKKYVQVDGWATLGAMLGVLPREVRSVKIDNGYEAYVELVRMNDGAVIGGASAICTREERNWSNRDEYAVKSMAATRATGKAYRLAFSWIMNLAGYESTPAEEMVDAEVTEIKEHAGNTKPKLNTPMSIEMANTAKSKDGRYYKDIPDDELALKRMGHVDFLNNKDNKGKEMELEDHKYALDAIRTIEMWRKTTG